MSIEFFSNYSGQPQSCSTITSIITKSEGSLTLYMLHYIASLNKRDIFTHSFPKIPCICQEYMQNLKLQLCGALKSLVYEKACVIL